MYFNYFLFYFICEYYIVIFEVFISLLFGIIFLLLLYLIYKPSLTVLYNIIGIMSPPLSLVQV